MDVLLIWAALLAAICVPIAWFVDLATAVMAFLVLAVFAWLLF